MNRSKYKPVYFGAFPLHHAAAKCHVVDVQKQLDAGANPYQPTEEGLTALHAAVANSSIAVVEVLLKRYAEDLSVASETIRHRFMWKPEQVEWKKRPILIAWTEEECQATLALAASCPAGIPLNVQVFVLLRNPQQGHQFVALDVCNCNKRTETLRLIRSLLPNGVLSLDRSDLRLNTVNYLHMACSYAKKEIIAMLVGKGASLAVHSGNEYSTPFMAACEALRKDIVAFLATNYLDRFDPGACNYQDYNALHKTVQRQHAEMVDQIVQVMLKHRMSKHRETESQAICQIFQFKSEECKYLTIWSFVSSLPMKELCRKYILLGQLDLRTRFEGSTMLGTFLQRGIAVDYCLKAIEGNLDLLRIEEDHTRSNILHKLIKCKLWSFANNLYKKHGSEVKEIFEIEDSVYKPALEVLRVLMHNSHEEGLVFVLQHHQDYYLKHIEHLEYLTSKQTCTKKAVHDRLCEIMMKRIPQLPATVAEKNNSTDLQDDAFYDILRDLRDSFTKTIKRLQVNDKRLEDYVNSNGRTFLHAAVDWSEKDLIQKLLALNFDVMKKDANGCLPIHLVRRSESIFDMLLAKDEPGQLAYVNDDGYNLLHISCRNGLRGSALEKLLEHGMDVNEATPDGHLPISLASCCGTVWFLINHGARVELLNEQLFNERLPKMQYCTAWELLPHIFKEGWFKQCAHRLLPWMVGNQSRDFFYCSNEQYLAKHEDIRRIIFDCLYEHSKEQASKLFSRVCHNAIVSCARWFLEYDYDIDYNCGYREFGSDSTPLLGLLTYMEVPNIDVVEKLLRKSVDVNAVDDRKRTALIVLAGNFRWAKHYDHSLETFRLLLKHGAKLDAQDESGNTALHCAFQWEQWEVVEFLIESGANTSLKNGSNKLASEMVPAYNRYLFGFIR